MASTTLKIVLFKSDTLRNGYHPLKLRVIHNRKVRYIGLGECCHPFHWLDDKDWIAPTHPNFSELDLLLQQKLLKASQSLLTLRTQREFYSLDDVINAITMKESTQTLSAYYMVVIEQCKKGGQVGTAKCYNDSRQFLERNNGGRPVEWNQLSVLWLKRLETDHRSRGYSLNGLSVYFRSLRAIINRAIEDGVFQGENPFKRYHIKHVKPQKRSMSVEDLHTIYSLDLSEWPVLHHYRQLFMLMFYLQGINFIDLAHLKQTDIKGGRLEYRRRKINKPLSVMLSDDAKEIIAELSPKAHPPLLLPILNLASPSPITTQERYHRKRFNKKLAKIAEKASITEFTGYAARHCWASMANEGQIPITAIAQALGHSSVKTTQIYLDELSHASADQASQKITELFNEKKEQARKNHGS